MLPQRRARPPSSVHSPALARAHVAGALPWWCRFWEISKKELEDRKAELRNKDREMEELEERHQVEIKVYKQKVRAT